MKKKNLKIPVFADDRVVIDTNLTIQVDNTGEGWLTPEQTLFLENAHLWARYAYSTNFKASKRLIYSYELPMPDVRDATASTVGRHFDMTTPVFNGATI